MPTLSAYANTENTAFLILKELGYQIWNDKETDLYCCEKGGWDFMANSAMELLGTVRVFEYHKPEKYQEYWWKMEGPRVLDDIPAEPIPYTPDYAQK